MKNTKNFFITLAICVVLSMAASVTTTKMIVEPAKPVAVVTFYGTSYQISPKISDYYKKGYIVKFIAGSSDQTSPYESYIVVMEKY